MKRNFSTIAHMKYTIGLMIILSFFGFLFNSCRPIVMFDVHVNELDSIYSKTSVKKEVLSNNVDLYVDYSTCVSDAVRNSDFFATIRSRITGLRPSLYPIRGENIEFFSSDMGEVNSELNRVSEINFAEIRGAVDRITSGNQQAILITDGEYITRQGGERIDLPYMRPGFIHWLEKGYSIHIIIEPYTERFGVKNHDKMRFYFIFTDDKLTDNAYNEIRKAFNFNDFPSLKYFKLTNSDLEVLRNDLKVNDNLSSTKDQKYSFDYIELDHKWETINKYIINATNDQGNPIPGGEPLIQDLALKTPDLSCFKIKQLTVKAYLYSEVYLDSLHRTELAIEIKDGFTIDNSMFSQDGKINIKLKDDILNQLYTDMQNLIRIDIILDNVENKIIDRDWFAWPSMFTGGVYNTSVYESIKQTIDNSLVNPKERNSGIIHTIFLKTTYYN